MKRKPSSEAGAALVIVVLSLVAAGLVGTAILAMATSSRYERVQYGIANRAYYLAESGASYVRARAQLDPAYPPPGGHPPVTNALANGDQFVVSACRTNITVTTVENGVTSTVSALHILAHSVGIANPGSAMEARRQVYFDMLKSGLDLTPFQTNLTFFTGNPDKPDVNTGMLNIEGFSKLEVKDTGPSQGISLAPKVDKVDGEGHVSFDWSGKPSLASLLLAAYEDQNQLLSYDVQIKMGYFPNVPSTHYMMGLSFRLHEDSGRTYGLSFFHSETNDSPEDLATDAPWVLDLDAAFSALRGTNTHLVLWSRDAAGSTLRLINHRRLPESFLYLESGTWELAYYSTLLLQLDEVYADASGTNRENRMTVYLAATNSSPVWPSYDPANAVWQEDAAWFPPSDMAPVVWADGAVTNTDSRITSDGFADNPNAEFGIHLFYDRNSANETFFRDYAIRLDSTGSPYGGTEIQW